MFITPNNEFERIDDLYFKNYKIIQDKRLFCFGTDAVLLADFASVKKNGTVVDLGCGNGIIPLLLCGKKEPQKIIGIEIQEPSAMLAERNVVLNGLSDKITILNADLKEATSLLPKGKFDHVVSNPPYKEKGSGILNPKDSLKIARHEILCELSDIIRTAADLLRFSGTFTLIHRPERLSDILCFMREYGIEAKRLRMVFPTPSLKPDMVLIEGKRGAKPKLTVEPPLILHNPDGSYTKEVMEIYGKES